MKCTNSHLTMTSRSSPIFQFSRPLRVRLRASVGPTKSRCESGSKLDALHTLARDSRASEPREAYGVRPACWRFCREPKHLADTFNRTSALRASLRLIAVSLLLLLALAGCTTKSKAKAQAQAAFIAGQQQALATMHQPSVPHISVVGPARNAITPSATG